MGEPWGRRDWSKCHRLEEKPVWQEQVSARPHGPFCCCSRCLRWSTPQGSFGLTAARHIVAASRGRAELLASRPRSERKGRDEGRLSPSGACPRWPADLPLGPVTFFMRVLGMATRPGSCQAVALPLSHIPAHRPQPQGLGTKFLTCGPLGDIQDLS